MRALDADLLSHQEIQALMRQCSATAPSGVRNLTLIALLWRSGLRISEALALRCKDLDLVAGRIVVQCGKGGKRRVVAVDGATAELVARWLSVRSRLEVGDGGFVFCTLKGGPLDASYVRHLLPRLARRAGLGKRVHAHGLRHRFAVDLVAEGAPITTVRDLLGHSSIAVTDTYLRRVGASEAIDFGRNRTWMVA